MLYRKDSKRGVQMANSDGEFHPQVGGSVFYVYLLAMVAALGGLLFGYDTAVISGAVGSLKARFQLDAEMTGWAASCALVGCMLGASCAGVLSDRYGRKVALLLSAALFAVSAIGSAVPRNLVEFIVARVIGGVGVGIASMQSPMYIAEVAPARIRGRLVSLNQLAIVFGMLVVYYVNKEIALVGDEAWNVELGWRWMFGSETLPAAIFLVLLFFVPESPRFLAKQGRESEALAILSRVGGAEHAEVEMREIRETITTESESIGPQLTVPGLLFIFIGGTIAATAEDGFFHHLLQPGLTAALVGVGLILLAVNVISHFMQGGSSAPRLPHGLRVALRIGVVLAILQQITGINVVLYYAPEIFKRAGALSDQAMNDTVIVGAINLLFTFVAIGVVDKAGRKLLLLVASVGMGVSLVLLGLVFSYGWFSEYWILIFVLTYVGSFAMAMGPVVWVVLSEIFPTRVRGRAMSVATLCLWISCYGVSQLFPILLDRLEGAVFFLYAAMCVVTFVFVAIFIPETKGKTLEEIEHSWEASS